MGVLVSAFSPLVTLLCTPVAHLDSPLLSSTLLSFAQSPPPRIVDVQWSHVDKRTPSPNHPARCQRDNTVPKAGEAAGQVCCDTLPILVWRQRSIHGCGSHTSSRFSESPTPNPPALRPYKHPRHIRIHPQARWTSRAVRRTLRRPAASTHLLDRALRRV